MKLEREGQWTSSVTVSSSTKRERVLEETEQTQAEEQASFCHRQAKQQRAAASSAKASLANERQQYCSRMRYERRIGSTLLFLESLQHLNLIPSIRAIRHPIRLVLPKDFSDDEISSSRHHRWWPWWPWGLDTGCASTSDKRNEIVKRLISLLEHPAVVSSDNSMP